MVEALCLGFPACYFQSLSKAASNIDNENCCGTISSHPVI